DDVLHGLPRDLHAGVDDVPPRVHPRAFSRMLFEADPLRQHDAKRMVDPSHFVRGLAIRDDVAHHGPYRIEYFDIQAASGFPRPPLAPVQLAINVCEFIPAPPVPPRRLSADAFPGGKIFLLSYAAPPG